MGEGILKADLTYKNGLLVEIAIYNLENGSDCNSFIRQSNGKFKHYHEYIKGKSEKEFKGVLFIDDISYHTPDAPAIYLTKYSVDKNGKAWITFDNLEHKDNTLDYKLALFDAEEMEDALKKVKPLYNNSNVEKHSPWCAPWNSHLRKNQIKK